MAPIGALVIVIQYCIRFMTKDYSYFGFLTKALAPFCVHMLALTFLTDRPNPEVYAPAGSSVGGQVQRNVLNIVILIAHVI